MQKPSRHKMLKKAKTKTKTKQQTNEQAKKQTKKQGETMSFQLSRARSIQYYTNITLDSS